MYNFRVSGDMIFAIEVKDLIENVDNCLLQWEYKDIIVFIGIEIKIYLKC